MRRRIRALARSMRGGTASGHEVTNSTGAGEGKYEEVADSFWGSEVEGVWDTRGLSAGRQGREAVMGYDFGWMLDSIKVLAMLYAWTLFVAGAFALGEKIVGSLKRKRGASIPRDAIKKR
jgi:hypothetical protein